MYWSSEFLSLVRRLVGGLRFLWYSSSSGSAQSCRFRMRLGIRDISENWIMHNRSHRDPKKSIYTRSVHGQAPPFFLGNRGIGDAYLALQQTRLEQHQRLPLELVHQLPQAHAQIRIPRLLAPH